MNENKLLDQLKEAAKDEVFMEGVFVSSDCKEFASKLALKGIELTDEEAKQLYEGMKSESSELAEDELDDVSGGLAISTAAWMVAGGASFLYGCYKSFKKKCK